MDLSAATLWWLAAGVAIAVELATGTFYLLMMAVGLAAGALATHAGLGFTAQVVAAALADSATKPSQRLLPLASNGRYRPRLCENAIWENRAPV